MDSTVIAFGIIVVAGLIVVIVLAKQLKRCSIDESGAPSGGHAGVRRSRRVRDRSMETPHSDLMSRLNPLGPLGPAVDAAGIWGTHHTSPSTGHEAHHHDGGHDGGGASDSGGSSCDGGGSSG